jgi:CheY-like chemotaxis protein
MSKEIIQDDYEIKVTEVAKLKPYQNNPRQINQNAIDQVKKSIEQNKFSNVIVVDKNMEIIAGHTRCEAAKQLGIKELPVFIAKNLDDEAVKRLRLLDNRLTELTPWDIEKLVAETYTLDDDMKKLFDPLLAQDLSEFDLSDDDYTPKEEKYGNAIIQYVMIFDNEEQQNTWYQFLAMLREQYPNEETHAARVHEYIKGLVNES